MGVLVMGSAALLNRYVPEWAGAEGKPEPSYAFVNLGYSFFAAAAGGLVTAWVSAENPLVHVLVLAVIVLAVAALSALQARGTQPVWFALAMVALTPVGVLAGGLVRLRVLGVF
jgi:NADH:ubiquinone oxidoreductase subunit 6 (subunit J)